MTIISSILVSISSSNESEGQKGLGSKPDIPDPSEYTYIFFPTPWSGGTPQKTAKDRKKENLKD